MSQVLRSVKNVTKGYSQVQVKVRNGRSPLLSPSLHAVMYESTCMEQEI